MTARLLREVQRARFESFRIAVGAMRLMKRVVRWTKADRLRLDCRRLMFK